jgi:hypothetical protein
MNWHDAEEWHWYRCSIIGCGAGPLRVRPHHRSRESWSIGFTDGPVWLISASEPRCPRCGDELEMLAPRGPTVLATVAGHYRM